MITDEVLPEIKKHSLEDIAGLDNCTILLSKRELEAIGEKVYKDYKTDEKSMEDWLRNAKEYMDLARMNRCTTKDDGQANIQYPLLSTAVMQFTARSVPEMAQSGKVAKPKVIGQDPDGRKLRKGRRICTALNYDVQDVMPNWSRERALVHSQLAVCGSAFTKTYYNPITGVNHSDLIPYDQIFINKWVKNLESAPRITQLVYMSPNDIVEHQRFGLFSEDYEQQDMVMDETDPEPIYHELIEQHCWLDLDKDGLKEPYIVVYHIAHKCVLRIAPRFDYLENKTVFLNDKGEVKKIIPIQYFTSYEFMSSPDGSFLGLGFGALIGDTNHAINTLLNQLVDAGSLSNMQTGIISKDLRLRDEDLKLGRGEWAFADTGTGQSLRDSMVQFSYKEPSMVLLQLLSVLKDAADGLTATSDVLTGTADVTNASPNSVAMLMKEGYKVYTFIQRHIFKSFGSELKKLVALKAKYMNQEDYLRLIDPTPAEQQEMFDNYGKVSDFDMEDVDVVPIVDVQDSTELESMNKASAVMQAGTQFVQMGATDPTMLAVYYYKSMGVENIESLVPPPPQQEAPPPPDPALIQLQQDMQVKMKELEIKEKELQLKAMEIQAKIKETEANTAKIQSETGVNAGKVNLDSNKQRFAEILESNKIQQAKDRLRVEAEQDNEWRRIERDKLSTMARRPSDESPT
jgi:chaperonin GroES